MTAGRLSLCAGLAILVAGVVLFFVSLRPPPPRTFQGTVKDLLPKTEELPGWQMEFKPIADTTEIKAKVNELLNYDDAVFAIYTKGTERMSIYIAYWAPGKMSYRLVAGHTPDVCWVGAGWNCEDARSGRRFTVPRGGQLPPAEVRTMEMNGQVEYVAFWHFLDGVPMSYETRGRPPWYASLSDLLSRSLSQRPEQFFIRVSSNVRPSDWSNAEFAFLSPLLSQTSATR